MMKTPEELRKMGIVVGDVVAPTPRTAEEKEEQRRARRRAERRGNRLERERKAKLKTARQMRWVEKHRPAWNEYKRKWRRDRRLSRGEVIQPQELRGEQFDEEG